MADLHQLADTLGTAGPGNNLLRALRPRDLALLAPDLEALSVPRDLVLHEPGDMVRFVHFPCGPTLASYLIVLEDGQTVETALIGREGAVGGVVSQGRLPAYARAIVQLPGPLLRLEIAKLEAAKERSPSLRNLFARYADCLIAQVFQSVACNAAHSIEQRIARWLLAALDRTGDHEVPLTQEQLASMLGVGRSYINRILQSLKQRGILSIRRGTMHLNDLEQMRSLSCGCHGAVRRHFEEVLQGVYPVEDEETAQGGGAEWPLLKVRG
jgi:CRP-like cAMP-binding protein